MALDTMGS